MSDLRTPEERECERCGRRERWDADVETWRVANRDPGESDESDSDGGDAEGAVGDVHCVHEWDIDGSFRPIE